MTGSPIGGPNAPGPLSKPRPKAVPKGRLAKLLGGSWKRKFCHGSHHLTLEVRKAGLGKSHKKKKRSGYHYLRKQTKKTGIPIKCRYLGITREKKAHTFKGNKGRELGDRRGADTSLQGDGKKLTGLKKRSEKIFEETTKGGLSYQRQSIENRGRN